MPEQRLAFGWLVPVAALALAAEGCGGQSSTDDYPSAPCASEGSTLAVGHIERLSAACVSVRIERVVTPGEQMLTAGTTIDGRMGTTYAYRHDFQNGDAVAMLVDAGSGSAGMELLPLQGDRVQVQWGGRQLEVDLDVLNAADCGEQLEAKRAVAKTLESSSSMMTSPPKGESTCTP